MIFVGRRGIRGDALNDIARLEQLTADLEMLARGELPLPEQLLEAPQLDGYRLATRSEPCLVGRCADHPRLHGPDIVTSGVWVFAPGLGFARTLSRLYRLGSPANGEAV